MLPAGLTPVHAGVFAGGALFHVEQETQYATIVS